MTLQKNECIDIKYIKTHYFYALQNKTTCMLGSQGYICIHYIPSSDKASLASPLLSIPTDFTCF